MSVWDTPEIQIVEEYVKFDKPGDRFAGKLISVKIQSFDDGGQAPALTLVTAEGEEKILTAGARNLKALLIEKRPNPGDWVEVVLISETPIGGGRKVRGWEVTVTPGQEAHLVSTPVPTQAPVASAPTTAPAAPDPQAVAAAMAALTPEQRALLGI